MEEGIGFYQQLEALEQSCLKMVKEAKEAERLLENKIADLEQRINDQHRGGHKGGR